MIVPLIALGAAILSLGTALIVLPRKPSLGLRGLGLEGCGSVLLLLGLAPLLFGVGFAFNNAVLIGLGALATVMIGIGSAIVTWGIWGR